MIGIGAEIAVEAFRLLDRALEMLEDHMLEVPGCFDQRDWDNLERLKQLASTRSGVTVKVVRGDSR